MARRFSRRIEDFVCENCGELVEGNGIGRLRMTI